MKVTGLLGKMTGIFLVGLVMSAGAGAFDHVASYEMFNGHGPDFDIDQAGNIHLVWADGHNVRYLKGERQGDGSIVFPPVSEAEVVPGSSGASFFRYGYPRIACAADGDLHVAWVSTGLRELYYARRHEGQWIDSRKVKSTYPKYLGNCDIEVDTEGRAYLAYQNPKKGPPYGTGVLCYKTGQGVLWDRTMTPIDSGEEKYPALALNSFQPIGPQNPLYVFWKEVHHFAKYDGLGWSNAQTVPEVPQFTGRVDIDVDAQNRPVLCYMKWVTSENWWVEGIYVKTCQDWGDNWNPAVKVSSAPEVVFREDYSPIAPEVGINADGNMMVTWNDDGVLKYNVYENGTWFESEQTLGYVNMHTCNGASSTNWGDIFVIHENQSSQMFFNHFRFNQAPRILLAGSAIREVEVADYVLGGNMNLLALVTDSDGQADIQSVKVYDSGTFQPLFNMYDDGRHGDMLPGDAIYGAELPDDFYLPGQRQTFLIVASDSKGAYSDVYPYLVIHGTAGTSGTPFSKDNLVQQHDPTRDMKTDGDGEWMVFMAGYLDSYLSVGADCWLDIVAWVQPVHDLPSAGIDRVELMYDNEPIMELPLLIEDEEWGRFYGYSIPIPGESLTPEFAGVMMLFQMRVVDKNGHAGPVWPYMEIPVQPTSTPTPTPTETPRPTAPPFPTPEPTGTPVPPHF